MIKNQEEDEFIAVRVQDPRVQNEGSWNAHVDYKIFFHTNSKSFTAKTSCVRRRYSEFAWLKKKMQKNAGLVPVPELPGKSIFSFSNEAFLEKRRTGLQSFLDKVLHTTVCLSDSQLHLFLQTQLPVGHIQDCVQGHTPYTVTDAILTYASSNLGFAQAQEEDSVKEDGLTAVSYESMESPAPHLPSRQVNGDHVPLESIVEVPVLNTVELMVCHSDESSLQVLQENNHLEAVIEQHCPAVAIFYLGDSHDELAAGSPPPAAQTRQTGCQIQTPVEVHSPIGPAFADDCEVELETEQVQAELDSIKDTDTSAQSVPRTEGQEEASLENESGDSRKETAAVCCETAVLEHLVSEEEEKEEVVSLEEDPAFKQNSSSTEQEIDEHHVGFEKASLGVEEEYLQHPIVADDHIQDGKSQERRGEESIEEKCTLLDYGQLTRDVVKSSNVEPQDEDSLSSASSDGSFPKIDSEDGISDETDNNIQKANGHLEASIKDLAPSSGVEDTSSFCLQMNRHSIDNGTLSDINNA